MKQLFQRLKTRRKRRRKDKETVESGFTAEARDGFPKTRVEKDVPVAFVSFVAEQIEEERTPTYHDGDDNSDGYHRYENDEGKDASESTQQDEVVRMALHASQRALPVASKGSAPKISCELLDKSAGECFEKGKIDDAVNKYEDALLLKRQTLLGQYNALKLSDASEEEKSRILASMATSINNLAYLRQVKGEASSLETLQSYEMALQIKREILGSKHLSVGKTLNNIGSVHYIQRNFFAAAENYEEARDILRAHLGEESLDVSTVSSNLGDVHYCLKQWQRASEEYRVALGLRWKLLGAKDPKVVRLMEQIADVECRMGNLNNAEVEECSSDQGTFEADMDQLHSDIDLDIEYFTSLEREAPMTLIRDKAEVFKGLRDLSRDDPLSFEASPMPAVWTDKSEAKSHPKSPDRLQKPEFEAPISPTTGIPVVVGVRVMQQDALTDPCPPSPKTPISRTRRVTTPTPTSAGSPSQQYTPVQRKEALESVRERLARLREEKEKKQLPMTPSSSDTKKLKDLSTSKSRLLKTSEIMTIEQGLDSLRQSQSDSPRENEGVSTRVSKLGRVRSAQEPTPAYFLRP